MTVAAFDRTSGRWPLAMRTGAISLVLGGGQKETYLEGHRPRYNREVHPRRQNTGFFNHDGTIRLWNPIGSRKQVIALGPANQRL